MNMKPVTGMVLQSGLEPEHLTAATLKNRHVYHSIIGANALVASQGG